MADRVTQIAVEVLDQPATVNARVTQIAVEVLRQVTSPTLGFPPRFW